MLSLAPLAPWLPRVFAALILALLFRADRFWTALASLFPSERQGPFARRGMLHRAMLRARRESLRARKSASKPNCKPRLSTRALVLDSLGCLVAGLSSAHLCGCTSLADLACSWPIVTCLFAILVALAEVVCCFTKSLLSPKTRSQQLWLPVIRVVVAVSLFAALFVGDWSSSLEALGSLAARVDSDWLCLATLDACVILCALACLDGIAEWAVAIFRSAAEAVRSIAELAHHCTTAPCVRPVKNALGCLADWVAVRCLRRWSPPSRSISRCSLLVVVIASGCSARPVSTEDDRSSDSTSPSLTPIIPIASCAVLVLAVVTVIIIKAYRTNVHQVPQMEVDDQDSTVDWTTLSERLGAKVTRLLRYEDETSEEFDKFYNKAARTQTIKLEEQPGAVLYAFETMRSYDSACKDYAESQGQSTGAAAAAAETPDPNQLLNASAMAYAFQHEYINKRGVLEALHEFLMASWDDFQRFSIRQQPRPQGAAGVATRSKSGVAALVTLDALPSTGTREATSSRGSAHMPPKETSTVKLACYSALIQSSMYGKSRLIFELGKSKMFVVYACIRSSPSEPSSSTSAAYPVADGLERDFLCEPLGNRKDTFLDTGFGFAAYYLAWLEHFSQWLDSQQEQPALADSDPTVAAAPLLLPPSHRAASPAQPMTSAAPSAQGAPLPSAAAPASESSPPSRPPIESELALPASETSSAPRSAPAVPPAPAAQPLSLQLSPALPAAAATAAAASLASVPSSATAAEGRPALFPAAAQVQSLAPTTSTLQEAAPSAPWQSEMAKRGVDLRSASAAAAPAAQSSSSAQSGAQSSTSSTKEQQHHSIYKAWFEYQTDAGVRRKVLHLARATLFLLKENSVYSGVDIADQVSASAFGETVSRAIDLESLKKRLSASFNTPLVLALDEASSLVECPRHFPNTRPLLVYARRALRFVQAKLQLPLILLLTDTSAKLSNFLPPRALVPSARKLDFDVCDLYPPFVHVATTDAFNAGRETWTVVSTDGGRHHTPKFTKDLFTLGRAGFGCYMQTLPVEDFVALLGAKLCGYSPDAIFTQDEPTLHRLEASLAVMASITVLDIAPSTRVASDLVSSRLATCLGVSDDRLSMLVAYVSEPILSFAARHVLLNSRFQEVILRDMIRIAGYGLAAPGPTGETVGELLVQLAIGVQKLPNFAQPNEAGEFIFKPLESVLASLLQPSILREVMQGLTVANYEPFVGLTHFIPCTYGLSLSHLEAFVNRSAGIRCKICQPGMDIVVPIIYVKQNAAEPGDPWMFSYWAIQIKNRCEDRLSDEQARAGLKFANCFTAQRSTGEQMDIPYLTMHLSMRGKRSFQHIITNGPELDPQQICVRCQGLNSFPMLARSPNILQLLDILLETRHDIHGLVHDQYQSLAEEMNPLVFKFPEVEAPRPPCTARTMKGAPCKNLAGPSGLCWVHDKPR